LDALERPRRRRLLRPGRLSVVYSTAGLSYGLAVSGACRQPVICINPALQKSNRADQGHTLPLIGLNGD
jgi:hypothetical protein